MGGDYGFAWNPHGTYAKGLTFFVKYVGLSPLEVLTCATKTGAEIMGREEEFGTPTPGKLADVLVLDGDVLADISALEDRARLLAVLQGGLPKAGRLASGNWASASTRKSPERKHSEVSSVPIAWPETLS
jgi:imidazolonepropionase-like amidohydrolase